MKDNRISIKKASKKKVAKYLSSKLPPINEIRVNQGGSQEIN